MDAPSVAADQGGAARPQQLVTAQQLNEERERSAALDRQLAGIRSKADESERLSGELLAERNRSQALAMRVSDLQGRATDLDLLRKQVETERERANKLDGERRAAETRADAAASTLEAQHVSTLVEELAAAKQAASKADTLQAQLDQERTRAAEVDQSAAEARDHAADWQKQFNAEHTRAATLDQDLTAERGKSAETNLQLHAAQEQVAQLRTDLNRSPSPDTVAGLENQLAAERSRAARLDQNLVEARDHIQRGVAAATALEAEQHRAEGLVARLSTMQEAVAQADVARKELQNDQSTIAELRDALEKGQTGEAALTAAQQSLNSEKEKSAALQAQLAAARQGADQAADLRKQLADEKSRSAAVARDLDAARGQVAQASDLATKLQSEQKRSADLDLQLLNARRTAANIDALQQKLAGNLAFNFSVPAQFYANDNVRQHSTASMDGVLRLADERQRNAALLARLAAAQITAEQMRNETDRAPRKPSPPIAQTTASIPNAPQIGVGNPAARDGSGALNVAAASGKKKLKTASLDLSRREATVASPTLPAGSAQEQPEAAAQEAAGTKAETVPQTQEQDSVTNVSASATTRVVLRYARNDPTARSRASDLESLLKENGWDVSEPLPAEGSLKKNLVTYFYSEDQTSAQRIAELVDISGTAQGRITVKHPLPRPGTVEIGIGEKK